VRGDAELIISCRSFSLFCLTVELAKKLHVQSSKTALAYNADETINQQLATHVQVFNASRYAVTHDKKARRYASSAIRMYFLRAPYSIQFNSIQFI